MEEWVKMALSAVVVVLLTSVFCYVMSQYNPAPGHPVYSNHPRW